MNIGAFLHPDPGSDFDSSRTQRAALGQRIGSQLPEIARLPQLHHVIPDEVRGAGDPSTRQQIFEVRVLRFRAIDHPKIQGAAAIDSACSYLPCLSMEVEQIQ